MTTEKIEFTQLGSSGISVSKVCLGTWAIGGWMWGGTDEEESILAIRSALDKGLNFIDTAPVYGFGRSEEIVGKALREYIKRDQVRIATKAGLDWDNKGNVFRNGTRQRIFKEIDDSLTRLQTDYIDLYQIHWPDPSTPIEETAQAMHDILKSGKIRAVGVSNFNPQQMDAFRSAAPLHSVQSPYNLFERKIEQDVLPYAKENGLAVMAYSSICRSLLSGTLTRDVKFKGDDLRLKDPKFQEPRFSEYLDAVTEFDKLAKRKYDRRVLALAVRWVLDQGAIALWGARRPDHLDPLEKIFGWRIGSDDLKEIDAVIQANIKHPVGPEFMAPPARKTL